MFIKKLTISNSTRVIRELEFTNGLNIIIDNTPLKDLRNTGNNVGKTTVLKLIDFCLGADGKIIFTDLESKKEVYQTVKDFLMNEKIEVTLCLVNDLDDPNTKEVVIKRNFLYNKQAIRDINGESVLDKDFEFELQKILLSNKQSDKPSFRQIISHNIRYKDESIGNTTDTLNKYTTGIEYEALYLYLLGCSYDDGAKKQALVTKLNQELVFKERLEKKQTKTTYEIALTMIEEDIENLKKKKTMLNVDESLVLNMNKLNQVKFEINRLSALISKTKIRENLIRNSIKELEQNISKIDLDQLKMLYLEVTCKVQGIQKSFEDLVLYHNRMIEEKKKYISMDLPSLAEKIRGYEKDLALSLKFENELSSLITRGDTFEEMEELIVDLNEKYRKKGEYEATILQLNECEENIESIRREIQVIDDYIFSDGFEEVLKEQVKKFNKYFASISNDLYGERYAISYEKKKSKNGQLFYKFYSFNSNFSSGKKQGEVLCFDLASIMFADEERIPCLHFLLNDKKELMHDNQLVKVADFVLENNIQLIVSILKDKLPSDILNKAHIAIELSQTDKLFRIEQ